MALFDRLTRRLAPTPHTPPHYQPPVLSAAAASPPARSAWTQHAPRPVAWQERAWQFYRSCGEARQAVDWIANGLSRFHLYIGKVQADGSGDPEPVDDAGLAGQILAELYNGPVGQRDMMYRLAVHLLVPGESWLIGYPTEPADPAASDQAGLGWFVASRREWSDAAEGRVRLKLPRDPRRDPEGWVEFPPDQVAVVPVYRPDPEDSSRATSAFEAALNVLDELDGLSRRIGADINSRLAGAGIAAIAESLSLPNPTASDGANPLHTDPVVTALIQAMMTAIQNPDSASAVAPILLRASDESFANGGPIKHLTFSTPFDAALPGLREQTRRRIAAVMDIPASVVTGVEDLNHWCVDDTTQIRTRTGWARHDQIEPGDLVLTLDHDTGVAEWQPVQDVARFPVTAHPMVLLHHAQHVSLSTLDHRWPIIRNDQRIIARTAELRDTDQLCLAAGTLPVEDCSRRRQLYTGIVWCPTTPNGTWLARRGGTVFWSGNSAWSVSDDAVKAHMGPLAGLICTTITRDILWPALRAAGESDVEDLAVWWDAAEIALRPDRSTEALNAYKEGIISGRAARREMAFSEEDAPNTDSAPAPAPGPPAPQAVSPDQPVDAPPGGQQTPGDRPNPPARPPAG